MTTAPQNARATPPAEQQAAPKAAPGEPFDECFPGEPRVAVPQGLISAACSAIRHKRDGVKVLEQLRRYSVGDLSQPLTPQPAPLSDDTALLDGLARLNWYVGPGDFYCDEAGGMNDYDDKNYGPEELRQAIRAALAAQGGK